MALLLSNCGGGDVYEPELFDPDGLVASFAIGRLVEDFGYSDADVDFDRLPFVFDSSPDSRIVVFAAFSEVGCDQAPTLRVRQIAGAIRVEITPRRANPEADCDAMPVAWVVELRLTNVLGDRSVSVELGAGR